MSTGPAHRPRRRLPPAAERIRIGIYQDGQRRMRDHYGFDLNTADAADRARALRAARPEDAGVAIALAGILASRGDDQAAASEARAAVELDPSNARAQTSLASLCMLEGDLAGALGHAQLAASLDPADATVQYNLGLAEHAAGDKGRAGAAFRAADALLRGEDPSAQPSRRRHWWRRG